MPLFHKRLDDITEADLEALIAVGDSEAKTIEYKGKLPDFGVAPPQKNKVLLEFLADVSSFANAAGGDIVYGMRAVNGVPTEVLGLQLTNVDGTMLQMEEIILSHIRPRVLFDIHPLTLSDPSKGVVLIVRVRRSFQPPHQITLERDFRFWARSSAGKYRLDVDELRNIFELSATTGERIRSFRAERLANIISEETPVSLIEGAKVVLHIVPYAAFNPAATFDLSVLKDDPKNQGLVKPFVAYSWNYIYNFDGLYVRESGNPKCISYVQVFRNGIIEAVDATVLSEYSNPPMIPHVEFETLLLDGAGRFLLAQQALGVEPPFFVMASLLGVRGYGMAWSGRVHPGEMRSIDRDNLLISDVTVESFEADLSQVLRPIFDAVWNAAGWARSQNYDAEGKRK